MHLTLINPPALMARYNYSTLSHPPLGLAYLAAGLRASGHQVSLIDAVGLGMDQLIEDPDNPGFIRQGLPNARILAKIPLETQVIAFSIMFSHAWPLIRQLIRAVRFRYPRAFLVAGGEHVTALPGLCLAQAPLDACVRGEGEAVLLALANAREKGFAWKTIPGLVWRETATEKIVPSGPPERLKHLDDWPWPDWSQVPLSAYTVYEGGGSQKTVPMLGTRGCPHRCHFCSAPNMWQGKWLARDPDCIVAEMHHYWQDEQVRSFQFVDISPFIRKDWLERLCQAIIKSNMDINWQMPVGLRFDHFDARTAALLVQSGCRDIQFAPESGSQRLLQKMNKQCRLTELRACVQNALQAGMSVSVLFIIGYPGETPADIRKTYDLIRRLAVWGVQEIAVSSFVPIPGSLMFDKLRQAGRLTVDDDFLREVSAATHLGRAISWNRPFGGRQLLVLKLGALFQFYGISFLFHPRRPLRLLRNLATGRRQTKTDRALAEIVAKLKFLHRR